MPVTYRKLKEWEDYASFNNFDKDSPFDSFEEMQSFLNKKLYTEEEIKEALLVGYDAFQDNASEMYDYIFKELFGDDEEVEQ